MSQTRKKDLIPAAAIAVLLAFTMVMLPFTAYAATQSGGNSAEFADLGAAQGYNLVCFDTFQNGSTDIRGKTFIGNEISATGGFTFGVPQADTSAEELAPTSNYALIFGAKDSGNFHVAGGGSQYKALVYNEAVKNEVSHVFNGSVDLWENEAKLQEMTGLDLSASDTELNGRTVTNFQEEMMTLSGQISGLTANGRVYVTPWNALALKGDRSDVNIFSIDGNNVAGSRKALSNMIEMHIDVPDGSTVIINVTGTDVGFPGGSTFSSKIETNSDGSLKEIGNPRTDISHSMTQRRVLWNYSEAETVTLKGSVSGSILAPSALLNFENEGGGNFEGTLVVNSLKTNGASFEGHNYPFNGKIPVPSEYPSSSQNNSSDGSSSQSSSSSDSSSSQSSSSSDSSSSQSGSPSIDNPSSSSSHSSESSNGGNHGGGGNGSPASTDSSSSSALEVISDGSTPLAAPSGSSSASGSSVSRTAVSSVPGSSGPEQIANDSVPLSSPKTGESKTAALIFSGVSILSLGTALFLNRRARMK